MFTLKWVGSFSAAKQRLDGGKLFEEWHLLPDGPSTQLREINQDYWISSSGIGAIQFDVSSRSIYAYPHDDVNTSLFERTLVHEWLPVVYQAWGWQVLHASAAVHLPRGIVVAFAGGTGTGKSTLGYGLGKRPGWQQISDDSLSFNIRDGSVHLLSIPNVVRLRSASAGHYGQQVYSHEPLDWPEMELSLSTIFFLEKAGGAEDSPGTASCTVPMSGAQTFPQLLKHAFAFTLQLPEHKRRLLHDYLRLANEVDAFQLIFSKSFTSLDETLDAVESHVC